MSGKKKGILLIGHGGVASDSPPGLAGELMRLESARVREGKGAPPSEREEELDAKLRSWPRTEQTDPYYYGLERIRDSLAKLRPDEQVVMAFNEFCAPSVDESIEVLIEGGAEEIQVLTTMLTPGGYHSETEIPDDLAAAKERYPEVDFSYVWPVQTDDFAGFLSQLLEAGG